MRHLFKLLIVLLCTPSFADDSWIFNKSFYSHVDGQRVRQYTAEPAVYVQEDVTYRDRLIQTWGYPLFWNYYLTFSNSVVYFR